MYACNLKLLDTYLGRYLYVILILFQVSMLFDKNIATLHTYVEIYVVKQMKKKPQKLSFQLSSQLYWTSSRTYDLDN